MKLDNKASSLATVDAVKGYVVKTSKEIDDLVYKHQNPMQRTLTWCSAC